MYGLISRFDPTVKSAGDNNLNLSGNAINGSGGNGVAPNSARKGGRIVHKTVNACLFPILAVDYVTLPLR